MGARVRAGTGDCMGAGGSCNKGSVRQSCCAGLVGTGDLHDSYCASHTNGEKCEDPNQATPQDEWTPTKCDPYFWHETCRPIEFCCGSPESPEHIHDICLCRGGYCMKEKRISRGSYCYC